MARWWRARTTSQRSVLCGLYARCAHFELFPDGRECAWVRAVTISSSDAIGVYSVALLIALLTPKLNLNFTVHFDGQRNLNRIALTVRCLSQRRPTSLAVLPGALGVVMFIVDASISLTTTHATSSTWPEFEDLPVLRGLVTPVC